MKSKILITKPFLPPLEEFEKYLTEIWNSKWLTNEGSCHKEFEKKLSEYLNVPFISLFANGTLALITALQCLKISGEVITTPYSFVATTHALWWNNIKPVFADIEDKTCNINPERIEALITPKTTAILPVHVYGIACDEERIRNIADTYGLKVIYDAAHAFGVNENGVSILNYGDLSILSFHATKTFQTFEGGAIISHDEKTKKRIDYLKNFGIANETTVVGPGINAKMNEFQAALGILQLQYYEENRKKRQKIDEIYRKEINKYSNIDYLTSNGDLELNYSYFPIFINDKNSNNLRDKLYTKFRENEIYVRRYFYPLISDLPTYRGLESASKANLSIAAKKANSVICLPIYDSMTMDEVERVIEVIRNFRKKL